MENLLVDKDGDIWFKQHDQDKYVCVTDPHLDAHSLHDLIYYFSPLHKLVEGGSVEPPFRPVPEGHWVWFNRSVLPETVRARVKYYDDGKLYYDLIVSVPQKEVQQDGF